jgi:glycine/D-amino acid oxidase-like deaminating enzyme
MRDDAQASTSIWMATANTPSQSRLRETIRTEVCIIGAGIAGLSTAYLLGLEGRSVVVLDDGLIGGGMTGRTTAHLSNAYDDRYVEIERLHGAEAARLTAESHTAAIKKISDIVIRERIDCDFAWLDGFLFAATPNDVELLDKELAAAHRAGLTGVEKVARAPLGSFDTGPALRFPRQAQFHPLNYLECLTRAIMRDGGRLFSHTHATKFEGGADAHVETSHGPVVNCEVIVVATNTPVNDCVAIHTRQAPYVTYVIGVIVPKNSITRALYWDTGDPYHYMRLQSEADHDVLIVGGEDNKTGQAHDGCERFARLEQWTRERFPQMLEVKYRWSGQVMEPVDGLAFIGRNPLDEDNVFIATGDSGQGMTHGTIAGMLLTDLIQGRRNKWEDLYSPARVKALPELDQWSVICPHPECGLVWNSTERTWDCPTHGSRFSADGRVYQGPANTDLTLLGN